MVYNRVLGGLPWRMLENARRKLLRPFVDEYLRITPGTVLTDGPFTWDHHGMAARTSAHWSENPRFENAHDESWSELEALDLCWRKRADLITPIRRENFRNEWNIHVACWAAENAMKLDGDFIECGVGTGIFSRCVMRYLNFNETNRVFWLADRWAPGETASFLEDFATVEKLFKPYRNARLVRGPIPDTLPRIEAGNVAYLYIDMNSAEPEIAAAEHFWPRMVPGAMMVLDDFGFLDHGEQRESFTAFAKRHDAPLLYCPTGQGIILKH